ncbi:MAG: carboxypeptidase regulatory-like domain-containing protein [Acidobacteriaceae bacterium]
MILRKCLLLLSFVAISTFAIGQAVSVNGGSIQGTITDPSGAVIPGATIVVTNPDTGYNHTLKTDSAGLYSIGPLTPGAYTISVTAPNFESLKVNTVVRTGTVTNGSEKLTIGQTTSTVEVNAGALQINTDQIGVAGVINQQQIDTLPVNGRNILDIAQLQPGVILESGMSFDPTKAGYSALSVSGVGGRTTRILLDGQDITDETVGTTIFNVPTGAIGDFQLNRSTQDVSGSVTSTGQVLLSTRSGTNTFHGQLFYNFQDQAVGFAQVNGLSAPFQRNQFGGSIGGPILKDKVFFFVDVERVKQDEEDAASASDLFSNPADIAGDPYLTTPILQQYPLIPAPFRDTYNTARVDYDAPHNLHLFARIAYSVNSDVSDFGDLYSVYENRDNVPAIVGGADFTTGHFTHSFRGGYEKFHNLLGDATAQYASSVYDPVPSLTFSDSTDGFFAGINDLAPQQTFQSDKQLRYDGTWTHGSHAVKFGGEMNRLQNGGFADFFGSSTLSIFGPGSLLPNCAGNPNLGPCPGDPANGYSTETYLIGNGNGAFAAAPAFGETSGGLSSWRFAAYVADVWQVTPYFTMTAGVRWSVDTDRANQDLPTPLCSSVDPSLQFPGCTGNTPLFDQYGSTTGGGTYGYKTHQPYADFGPQAGFVFSPGTHKYSIRGGIGIYYESSVFNNTGNARPTTIPPNVTGAFFNDAAACSDIFPGSTLGSENGGNGPIASTGETLSTLCSESQAAAAPGVASIRSQYQAQTRNVAAPNPNYIGLPTGEDLIASDVYAGPYVAPYSIQFNGGVQTKLTQGMILSVDYVHNATMKIPLEVDTNRVGAANTLNIATAQAAIAATVAGYPACPQGYTAAAIDCAIFNGANITDFSNNGLDSGNNGYNFGGAPAVQTGAAFGGINTNVGIGKFILPIGQSGYDALQVVLQEQKAHPMRGIVSSNFQISYTLSRSVNDQAGSSTEDQFFAGASAWDYNDPSYYLGRSTLDHSNELSFGGSAGIKYGLNVAVVGHFYSAPATSLTLDDTEFGGQGEIFRTDVTGDGSFGDLLPGTLPGSYEHTVKGAKLNQVISNYNSTAAGQATPAGQALISAGLMSLGQLQALGAVQQPIALAPGAPLSNAAFRTFDLSLNYPIVLSRFRRGLSVEPGIAFYNVFNMSNFGAPSGILLNTADAGGSTNTSVPGYLNGPNSQEILNSQFRVQRGSGTFDQGAPRTTEFQLKVNF